MKERAVMRVKGISRNDSSSAFISTASIFIIFIVIFVIGALYDLLEIRDLDDFMHQPTEYAQGIVKYVESSTNGDDGINYNSLITFKTT
jgi:hypothetical protein